jgi:hypothetical protein
MAALVPLLLAFGLVARSSPVTDEAGERVSLAGDRASADALRLLVDHRNATSGVDVLQTWLQVEELEALRARPPVPSADERSLRDAARRRRERHQLGVLLLGGALSVPAVCVVLGWRWLIWLAVSTTLIGARVVAASYQSLMLALSLSLYAGLATLQKAAALVTTRLSCVSSRRKLDELDAILKAQAHLHSPATYAEWCDTAAMRDELSGAQAWRAQVLHSNGTPRDPMGPHGAP